jgi:hypothetical protein
MSAWPRMSEAHLVCGRGLLGRCRWRGEFFGQPYGRRSVRTEQSVARCVFESKTRVLAAGIGHFGGGSAVSTMASPRSPLRAVCSEEVVR